MKTNQFKPPKKILAVLNLSDNFGGAEKRYINLFNYLDKERDDFILVINNVLYQILNEGGILHPSKNIELFYPPFYSHKRVEKNAGDHKSHTIEVDKKPAGIRSWLGANKYFVKTFIIWLSYTRFLFKLKRKYTFNWIYGVWSGGMFSWPFCKLTGCKLIYSANSHNELSMFRGYLQYFDSQYSVVKHADRIDFLAPGLVREFEAEAGTIPASKISITPNSFADYTNYLPQFPKENWVVFMSRLNHLKNPLLFCEAAKLFGERYQVFSSVQFIIGGDGPMASAVQEFIAENPECNLKYLGLVMKPWEILNKSKVFLAIGEYENYPSQIALEAMAAGNAIVATDVGDTRWLISENEGELVENNVEKICDAILELISDDGICKQKGINARHAALNKHSVESFVNYFVSLFS